MMQAPMRPSGDGAEHVEIGEECLWRRDVVTETRRRSLVGETEDEQRVSQDELARRLRPGEVVLIEATNLTRRQSMRRDHRGEADTVVRLGARQRHEVLHCGMRDQAAVLDVLLDHGGQRAHETEAP